MKEGENKYKFHQNKHSFKDKYHPGIQYLFVE